MNITNRLSALLANADQIAVLISASDRARIVALHQQATDASSPYFAANSGTLWASIYDLIGPSVRTAYGHDVPAQTELSEDEVYPEVLNAVMESVLAKAA